MKERKMSAGRASSAGQAFAKYASLNVLAMIGVSLYILVDTFFISLAEGANGVAALNLVLPIYSLIFAIGSMTGTGSATRFAILRARGEAQAEKCFANAVEFAFIIGAVFIAIGAFCPEKVLEIMGGDEVIVATGRSYTRIFMLFAPCFMLNYIFTAFVRNDGNPSVAMAGTLTSSLSNILLDYIFMFPLKMGMSGAALATGMSPLISVAVCMIHFCSKRNTVRFKPCLPSVRLLFRGWQLGTAAFVGEMSSGVTTTVFNFIILGLEGNIGVAAYGVIANFAMVATGVFNGLAQGAQPLVSKFYGEGDNASVKNVLKLAVITAGAVSVAIAAAVMVFAPNMVALFNSEGSAELAACAEPGARIYFTGFVFAGFNIIGTSFLSAAERAVESFVGAMLRGFAAIVGFAFLLSAFWGMTGVWLAFPAAEAVTAIVTAVFLVKWVKNNRTAA
jgi:Na+-driven multidrug efflux pump